MTPEFGQRDPYYGSPKIQSFKGSQAWGFPAGFQGSRFQAPRFQTCKRPGFQDSNVAGLQGCKNTRLAGQGSNLQGSIQGCRFPRSQSSKVPARFQQDSKICSSVPGHFPDTTPRPRLKLSRICCWELGLVEKLSFRSKRQQWFHSRSTGSTSVFGVSEGGVLVSLSCRMCLFDFAFQMRAFTVALLLPDIINSIWTYIGVGWCWF